MQMAESRSLLREFLKTVILFMKEVIIMSTLQAAIEAIQSLKLKSRAKNVRVSDKLLGKFKGIIPENKSSTQFIKDLRNTMYGKLAN